MKFELLQPKYIKDILKLEKQCFGKLHLRKKHLLSMMNEPHCCCEVLIDNNNVVGYYFAYQSGHFVDIGNIAIFEQYRHQGYGKAIMNRILSGAKEHNLYLVQLLVRKTNIIAQHLYATSDFEFVDELKEFYRDNHENAYVMEWTNCNHDFVKLSKPILRIKSNFKYITPEVYKAMVKIHKGDNNEKDVELAKH